MNWKKFWEWYDRITNTIIAVGFLTLAIFVVVRLLNG